MTKKFQIQTQEYQNLLNSFFSINKKLNKEKKDAIKKQKIELKLKLEKNQQKKKTKRKNH